MACPKRTTSPLERRGVVLDMGRHPLADGRGVEPVLRCVSSGYMAQGCSCTRTVPASVVAGAWTAELRRTGEGNGFFHFNWRGQVWLGFGLPTGEVRGVFCPGHRAEREARSAGCEGQHYAPAAVSA